ncbi:MFS transporter [Isoptericola sp. NPDC057191]|uniref:MFS transporter n=1 Tax=Isoptericola sp. NPDC057191 TaxID=3346041 RepID=UPI0036282A91
MRRSWLGAFSALFVCSWAGNQFTPVLLMYEQVQGYGDATVNAFLGVYVLGLAPALLVAGTLSDRYGRRPVMLVATVCAMAASAVLALGFLGPLPIYVGRLLAGLTVGTATSVGTSWLKELSQVPFDRAADAGSGARRASLAFTLGSGVGALVAGCLAQWGPWPEVLPFVVHLVVTAPFLLVVLRTPETSTLGGGSGPWWRGLGVPAAGHRRFTRVVAVVAPWIFVVAALAYGYAPVLLRDQTQGLGVAYATLVTVVALGVAAVVQPLAKRLDAVDSARGLAVAVALLTAAVACVGLTVTTGGPWWGVGAAVVAGAGMGIGLSSALLEVQRIAGPRHLAGLTGVFYAVAYAGFLTPAVMAAVTPPFTTAQLFAVLVVLGIVSTGVVVARSRTHLPGA